MQHVPASALEMVGLETMTGVTPGALVMASKWTKPIRPIPMTPTLIISLVSIDSTLMESEEARRAAVENEGAKAVVLESNAAIKMERKTFMMEQDELWIVC